MPARYESSPASPEPLARPLTFPFSGKTAKNRLLKSAMAESLATWSATEPSKRGIPTPELVEVYRRYVTYPLPSRMKHLDANQIFLDGAKGQTTLASSPQATSQSSLRT